MSGEEVVNVRQIPTQSSTHERVKKLPKSSKIPTPYTYEPSDDGTDENLLIILHGLGDTHIPFAKLAKQLKLPQTATLALRAPEQIPYLDAPAFQWYTSFDLLGETITNPNPTPALNLLYSIASHLIEDCQWPPERIHFFGFGQGGTVAAEYVLQWWKEELSNHPKDHDDATLVSLGSVTTVVGPLISYPTLSEPCPTPVMIFHRNPSPSDPEDQMTLPSAALVAFRKGYANIQESKGSPGGGMPRSKAEWEPIMRFWSEQLNRRQMEGLYEVMSEMTPFK